ncbi:unnamed protein product [Chondrus crispus]|uniref:Uncharacterized protein n=1 Tax=Chondrus crispus TaxID=2769 RepID=R7QT35_CHOCR|nr:unnamed protein product [Chondrus crispus]CDF40676.1 unnamed protein product [Chondrus crispus]|eukprot:XP_005710970.1 unnamed protein product [Chondrus crispus]
MIIAFARTSNLAVPRRGMELNSHTHMCKINRLPFIILFEKDDLTGVHATEFRIYENIRLRCHKKTSMTVAGSIHFTFAQKSQHHNQNAVEPTEVPNS